MSYNATIYAKDEATGEVKSVFVGEVFEGAGRWIIARNNSIQRFDRPDPEVADRDIRLEHARNGRILEVVVDECSGYIDHMRGGFRSGVTDRVAEYTAAAS